jgi:hypothetical protein
LSAPFPCPASPPLGWAARSHSTADYVLIVPFGYKVCEKGPLKTQAESSRAEASCATGSPQLRSSSFIRFTCENARRRPRAPRGRTTRRANGLCAHDPS